MSERHTLTGNSTASDRQYQIFYREIKSDDLELTEEAFEEEDAQGKTRGRTYRLIS